MRTRTYRGYKIKPIQVVLYQVFNAEEWDGSYRYWDWEAQSLLEARDYIDSQFTQNPVNRDNFISYSIATGFKLKEN
ncbi:hypothetical protein ERIC1_2c00100 [Paenibacillus larvae subsp. larvae DSM 25719]|uniref:hypothetical protein n=1 Tax=Paenibacillus larvae TaxID=1464 RepID=UPI0003DD5879|nr:hypothetical protein [Paenibacillus larvae]ETK25822.1 hypothetical protein ERIC1_2c00100 [Paenibacillus larvae subsp. larvae DSM 25719]